MSRGHWVLGPGAPGSGSREAALQLKVQKNHADCCLDTADLLTLRLRVPTALRNEIIEKPGIKSVPVFLGPRLSQYQLYFLPPFCNTANFFGGRTALCRRAPPGAALPFSISFRMGQHRLYLLRSNFLIPEQRLHSPFAPAEDAEASPCSALCCAASFRFVTAGHCCPDFLVKVRIAASAAKVRTRKPAPPSTPPARSVILQKVIIVIPPRIKP